MKCQSLSTQVEINDDQMCKAPSIHFMRLNSKIGEEAIARIKDPAESRHIYTDGVCSNCWFLAPPESLLHGSFEFQMNAMHACTNSEETAIEVKTGDWKCKNGK
jgi:hypothetical protein